MRLLLVEDEKRMAQALCELLRQENYEVCHKSDGISALEEVRTGMYDVIVLDVMLPKMNGFELLRQARQEGVKTPVLMLTAKSEIDDKVKGLDYGADDYLTKPFMTKELTARLRALIRRNINSDDGSLCFGDISLDMGAKSLTCLTNSQNVRLGEKEYKILEYMISNQGQVMTREQIAIRIWGYDNDAEYNNVEVYMTFTRKKLAFVGAKTEIKSVRGVGYELRYNNV